MDEKLRRCGCYGCLAAPKVIQPPDFEEMGGTEGSKIHIFCVMSRIDEIYNGFMHITPSTLHAGYVGNIVLGILYALTPRPNVMTCWQHHFGYTLRSTVEPSVGVFSFFDLRMFCMPLRGRMR